MEREAAILQSGLQLSPVGLAAHQIDVTADSESDFKSAKDHEKPNLDHCGPQVEVNPADRFRFGSGPNQSHHQRAQRNADDEKAKTAVPLGIIGIRIHDAQFYTPEASVPIEKPGFFKAEQMVQWGPFGRRRRRRGRRPKTVGTSRGARRDRPGRGRRR